MKIMSAWLAEKIKAVMAALGLGAGILDTVIIFYLLVRWQILKRAESLHRFLPVPRRLTMRCNNQRRIIFISPDTNFTDVLYEVLLRKDYAIPARFFPEVIFDVGACYGISTVFLSCAYPDAKIYAFEPSAPTFGFLQRTAAPLKNVEVFNKAVYTFTGSIKLYSDNRHGGWNTLLPLHAHGEEVACVSLDDFMKDRNINHIDLLKIDVEGAELEIFKTLTGLEKISYIVGEFHYYAYRHADIMGVLGGNFDVRIIQANIKYPVFHAVNRKIMET
jgi:FkbM family methyltransferase